MLAKGLLFAFVAGVMTNIFCSNTYIGGAVTFGLCSIHFFLQLAAQNVIEEIRKKEE